jgi:hypothetical protein
MTQLTGRHKPALQIDVRLDHNFLLVHDVMSHPLDISSYGDDDTAMHLSSAFDEDAVHPTELI